MDLAARPADWPFRDAARRLRVRPHDWCVVEVGDGPDLLLLHGAGGSGHSFRALIPLLAPQYRCLVPDLPGQGCTRAGAKARLGLDPMAQDLWALCDAAGWRPTAIIGHSAGAALALRMAELRPGPAVVGINAALSTFDGVAGVLFPVLARTLALVPFLPAGIARLWGTRAKVESLLASTGSPLDTDGQAQYLALVRDADHVEGTLGMMAQWRLEGLIARLPALPQPTLLIAASGDRAVPAGVSRQVAERMAQASFVELAQGGHLVHEEAPEAVAGVVLPWLAAQRV
jgi:magnesium chelatase accessory protein